MVLNGICLIEGVSLSANVKYNRSPESVSTLIWQQYHPMNPCRTCQSICIYGKRPQVGSKSDVTACKNAKIFNSFASYFHIVVWVACCTEGDGGRPRSASILGG